MRIKLDHGAECMCDFSGWHRLGQLLAPSRSSHAIRWCEIIRNGPRGSRRIVGIFHRSQNNLHSVKSTVSCSAAAVEPFITSQESRVAAAVRLESTTSTVFRGEDQVHYSFDASAAMRLSVSRNASSIRHSYSLQIFVHVTFRATRRVQLQNKIRAHRLSWKNSPTTRGLFNAEKICHVDHERFGGFQSQNNYKLQNRSSGP